MRVYVAGAYSADNVLSILDNIRIGMRASTEVLLLGHSPFCPWLDFHFQLMLRPGEELTVEQYYKYSMDWLEVSDIVYVCNYRFSSQGTKAERNRAIDLGIPVVYNFEALEEMIDKSERNNAI